MCNHALMYSCLTYLFERLSFLRVGFSCLLERLLRGHLSFQPLRVSFLKDFSAGIFSECSFR